MASAFKAYWLAAWRTATKISVRHSGAWVEVQRIQAWKTNPATGLVGWREVYKKAGTTPPAPPPPAPPPPPPPPPVVLTVTITPSSISRTVKNGSGFITTGLATASASGGTGPYTYSWEALDWTSSYSPPVANSSSAAATTFSQDNMGSDDTESANFRVTAVDSLGNFGTANIHVTWTTYTWSKYNL